MKRISRNVSIILRSERLIARRQLAVFRRQTGFVAAAGIVAALGLIMLNLAGYLTLTTVVSNPAAAGIVAAVNFLLAAILVSMAGKSNIEEETAPVAEVRDMALEDLEAEIMGAVGDVKETVDDLRRAAKDPFGQIGPKLAGTVASAVIKNLKK